MAQAIVQNAPAGAVTSRPAVVAAPEDTIDRRKLVAFFCMVFGMFMAILDIQVVSASLSEIQAGLSATPDQVAWVQTSYLIAEVIMIPLSGILSRAFSTRYLFAASCAGFTTASFLCSQSTTLDQMIVFRALQGFIGGAMIPTVFASAYTIFPRSKMPVITPVIGLVATLGPTIGPTVGGYLTEMFSWHWLFLINIIPGILVTVATWNLVDFDEPDLSILETFDWTGLIGMAAFLGALEYTLEEGPQNNWFSDSTITLTATVSAVGALVFFWQAFRSKHPIVDLSAFLNRNFWTGSMLSFVMGIGLYGLTFLYPVYLARVRGYDSLQIGETMFVSGLTMFVSAPIVGRLITRMDPRLMIALGFAGFSLGTYQASFMTKDWDFWELLMPQLLRGGSLMLCMVPINNLSLGTMPPSKMKNASGIYNLTRNLGGAVGLAMINTMINNRLDLHLQRLRDDFNWSRPIAVQRLAAMTHAFASKGSNAHLAAIKQMMLLVRQQATVMSLADVFYALTWLFLSLIVLVPLMKRPKPGGAPGGGGH
ncbi:MAG: DHA2 family efflux MFS transporter permease subunit [Hyphomicrobiales bacterium]|nr:DHA2 family efflux MFS transporter permease subunit [Hyphomicrobiales bacterium]